MSGVARNFFILGIVYVICGLTLGLVMGISDDHSQMPTHAHIMLAGFMLSTVMAYFYHLFPDRARTALATVHFWLAAVSGIVFMTGLFFMFRGVTSAEPVVAIGSMAFFLSVLLFIWNAIPVLRKA